jgi:dTDP-4-amino-4,6-dideoxygalactose transaminase
MTTNKTVGEAMSISGTIPLVDLRKAHAEVADEIDAGMREVLDGAAFINGPAVKAFEHEYAEFSGVPYCVGVANGTDAIELALRAAEVPAGAQVVLPANTFVATAEAVVRAGARPVLTDVDPDHLLMDPSALAAAAGPDTAAVIPVHLYGQMAPMRAIADLAAQRGAVVIEDAAQAQGATQSGHSPAALSVAAATSFYPGKNLGAYGDAGAVLTGSETIADRLRLLRDHGSARKYEHATFGCNSRLDSLQAAVLRVKLRHLAAWNERRRRAAARYDEMLAGIDDVTLPLTSRENDHVWHLYVIRVPRRDAVLELLHELGIQAGIHYPVPVHLQPAFRSLGYGPGDFPVTEAAAASIISLPLYPQITPDQQLRVAEAVRKAMT